LPVFGWVEKADCSAFVENRTPESCFVSRQNRRGAASKNFATAKFYAEPILATRTKTNTVSFCAGKKSAVATFLENRSLFEHFLEFLNEQKIQTGD
jgi:hypothetical protein